jgi:periplasmic divalent cation tolerance protein
MASIEDRYRIMMTTAGSDEQAESIARALVDRRLAACVNIVNGACSVFRWKGETVREQEPLLIIKTTADKFSEIRNAIRELHTYDLPEVVSISMSDGDVDYLNWIDDSVRNG